MNTPLKMTLALLVYASSQALAEAPKTAGAVTDAAESSQWALAISNEKPDRSLYVKERDLVLPCLVGSDPFVPFPSRARRDNVLSGMATVGIRLDSEGKPQDFLIVEYTQKYFAEALLYAVQHEEFYARRVKGDSVPGSFSITMPFSLSGETDPIDPNRPATVSMNAMEQMGAQADRVSDGGKRPKMAYKPHHESEIDGHVLKAVAVSSPLLPNDSAGDSLKVLVAFYVDEQGNVRLPNVESEASPAVVSQVMKAVLAWKFSPPMIKGKAVLAYANRTLTFTKKTSVSPSGVEASGDVHQK